MKKKCKLFGLAVLVTAIVFISAACKNGSTDPDPREAYFGTWKMTFNSPRYIQVTISANSFKLNDFENNSLTSSYTITGLSWTPANGAVPNYPTGYIMKGTVTARSGGISPTKPDDSHANIGDTAVEYWFIHTGGNSLVKGRPSEPGGDVFGGVFTKQH